MVKAMWVYIVFAPGAADAQLIELAIIIELLIKR